VFKYVKSPAAAALITVVLFVILFPPPTNEVEPTTFLGVLVAATFN
jgi:hypothetical protein